jgi:hypothetical protein
MSIIDSTVGLSHVWYSGVSSEDGEERARGRRYKAMSIPFGWQRPLFLILKPSECHVRDSAYSKDSKDQGNSQIFYGCLWIDAHLDGRGVTHPSALPNTGAPFSRASGLYIYATYNLHIVYISTNYFCVHVGPGGKQRDQCPCRHHRCWYVANLSFGHKYTFKGKFSFIFLILLFSVRIGVIVNITTVVIFVFVLPCIGGILYWIGLPILICFACCCPSKQEETVIVRRAPEQMVNNNIVVMAGNASYPPNQPMVFTHSSGGTPGSQPYYTPQNYEYAPTPPYEQHKYTQNSNVTQ